MASIGYLDTKTTHGDYCSLTANFDEDRFLFLDARDALTATMLLIMLSADTVEMTPRVEKFALELRKMLDELDTKP